MIESTQGLGNDLAGVMALQRKLTGMERDLEAIQVQIAHNINNVKMNMIVYFSGRGSFLYFLNSIIIFASFRANWMT